MGMEFTNNPASSKRVLLPLEPDFSNMYDSNVVVELPTTTGDRTTDKLLRLPSLDIFSGGISLEININPRRGGDVDPLLHSPLRDLHLQTPQKKQKVRKIQTFSQ